MKLNNFRRSAASMLTFAMMLMLFSPSLVWANSRLAPLDTTAGARATALSGIMKRDVRKEFSREELDQMRSVLADLVEGNREVADLFPAAPGAGKTSGKGNQYDAIREQIQNMSDKELTMLRSAMDPVSMQRKLARSRAVIANFKNTANTVGLPGIDSYCGAPVSTEAIIASDVVYFLAEAVRDIAQDGCNEVVVILGEGGNLRAACLITDAVYIIAKAVNQGIHFCDDDYAASVGQASYDRLGHIHDDLAASVANDDSNKSMIVNNDNTNKDTIVNNDNTNKDTIVNNDNTNKTTIVNNDNANTAALTLLINAALTQIIDNANANKNELKNLLLRTQIEADLASTDAAVLVALYQTPSTVCTTPSIPNPTTQCGLLDLVSAIVHETIVNQGNSASAQALWVQAEALKASQPKAAYATFRKAYKASSK